MFVSGLSNLNVDKLSDRPNARPALREMTPQRFSRSVMFIIGGAGALFVAIFLLKLLRTQLEFDGSATVPMLATFVFLPLLLIVFVSPIFITLCLARSLYFRLNHAKFPAIWNLLHIPVTFLSTVCAVLYAAKFFGLESTPPVTFPWCVLVAFNFIIFLCHYDARDKTLFKETEGAARIGGLVAGVSMGGLSLLALPLIAKMGPAVLGRTPSLKIINSQYAFLTIALSVSFCAGLGILWACQMFDEKVKH